MKMKFLFLLGLTALFSSTYLSAEEVSLDKKWLHIYAPEGVRDLKEIPYDSIKDISFLKGDVNHPDMLSAPGFEKMQITFKSDADPWMLTLSDIDRFDITSDLPVIDINLVDYPEASDLWDKELYLDAVVNLDGAGEFDDISGWETKIKGRGNTTWGCQKKPYRFKASKKISLLGLKKAKSYALIANYIDSSHMRNFVALELARMLGMPFSNSCIPVRVRFNNNDKGLYFLTEKIGIGGASVDIDEDTDWMLELDTSMDEDYCYVSEPYSLPVMVKDPDLSEIYPQDPEAQWEIIKADFNSVLELLKDCEDESWRDLIDSESLINYLLVFNLADNMEIRHPKSVYIYKTLSDNKYHFGPVWDFDWAYHYSSRGEFYVEPDFPLLHPVGSLGSVFFYELCQLPGLSEELIQRWDNMIENIYPQLRESMDAYAKKIKAAAMKDGLIWSEKPEVPATDSFDFDDKYDYLKTWLDRRIEAASNPPARLIYYVPGYKW